MQPEDPKKPSQEDQAMAEQLAPIRAAPREKDTTTFLTAMGATNDEEDEDAHMRGGQDNDDFWAENGQRR